MVGYLSVSKAAKLVGVSRTEIQDKIRAGVLETFEGQVAFDKLRSAYPGATLESNKEIARVRRIQAKAINKTVINAMTSEKELRREVFRLRHDLRNATEQLHLYHDFTSELRTRLTDMQSECNQRQKLMLRALLGWMNTQIQHNTKK